MSCPPCETFNQYAAPGTMVDTEVYPPSYLKKFEMRIPDGIVMIELVSIVSFTDPMIFQPPWRTIVSLSIGVPAIHVFCAAGNRIQ